MHECYMSNRPRYGVLKGGVVTMNPQDDLDRMLQGDDQIPASPAQIDDQGDSTQVVDQQSPEEIEFNSLTGSTKERIRALAREKRDLQIQVEQFRNNPINNVIPPAPNSAFRDPQQEAALQTLANYGVATDEKVDKKLDDRINSMRWEIEQGRLESKYSGSKGEPQYVREEVETFIQSHPQYRTYAPEDVFKYKMFPDEFTNLEVQKQGGKPKQTSTFKPTKAAAQPEGLSLEYIMERMDLSKHSDALQWQDEHKAEIDKVLQNMQA